MKGTFRFILLFVWGTAAGVIPLTSLAQAVEDCANAIDDDGDGLIDLNDPECACEVNAPVSRIPNPSFEDINCCPDSRSQLYCAQGWDQASLATTDLIHDCGWGGWPQFAPPRPFPDGKGIVGFRDGRSFDNNDNIQVNWKEYAGACLTAPLEAGITYRFEMDVGFVSSLVSPLIDLTMFGTTSCEFLPFGYSSEEFGCPTNSPDWRELASVELGWNRGWIKAQLEVTPDQDIHAIAIGPSCRPTRGDRSTYYFLDNLILDERNNFTWAVKTRGNPCGNDFTLYVDNLPGYTYQWYRNGIAMVGETNASLVVTEESIYQVRIVNGQDCRTSGEYIYTVPFIEEDVSVTICEYETFDFGGRILDDPGLYITNFVSTQGCDSVVFLNLNKYSSGKDTQFVKLFEGEEYVFAGQTFRDKGIHNATLIDDDGCNYFVQVVVDYYEVYWPNVFSPNGDGQNDFFNIYGNSDLISIKEMSIFNRWGGRVFRGENLQPNDGDGWDGSGTGDTQGDGVFVFRVLLEMVDGTEKDLYGTVMMLK